ncbi:glycosyltransferase family 87 protein [Flavobacterium sedimenticola]|uniref:Glycosyltransferase family 87 protein n=1 Tax=Flavobacterium sedimenticola TaxID=3043286 RepID=A0ABT6XL79_9FLAO|nr:glycosyltransferase family 87 protein [Flavobacterium sedimenticola]MDI9255838.1 glycosyltransferase family 87 protein [Flavobacterium sedimenticola]
MKRIGQQYYPLLPLLLLCGYFVFRAIQFPAHDFANYYFGGKFLAEGHFNADIYFPYEFNKAIFDAGHSGIFVSYAPNTPFLAVFFLLFSFFSLAVAKCIFNGISVVLLVFSCYRLSSYYKIDPKYLILLPLVFLVPIKNNLLFGQVYFLIFFLLAEGWLAYEKRQWRWVGLFWSLAIVIKVFPVLLIALLVFRRQWKPLLYLVGFSLLFLGTSILFTGMDIWFFYLKEVLPKASNGEIATGFVDNYQSVFMFLKRCLVLDNIENPEPFFNYPGLFSATIMAFKISILVIGYFVSRRVSITPFGFSYWILAMIILSPYGSTYSLILLLFSFFALLKSDLSMVKKGFVLALIFLINNLPLSLFIDNEFPLSYLRLFLLLFFAVFFIGFISKKSIGLKAVFSGGIILLTVSFFNSTAIENASGLLPAESPILIYDYEIKNNQLTYFYWNETGKNSGVLPIRVEAQKAIKKNEVSLNFEKSNKRKPIVVNNNTLIYLSDYGRGIGFFTLRKFKIR